MLNYLSIVYFLFFCCSFLDAQQSSSIRIVSYNVENLFDTFDDSTTSDNEFLPQGAMFWSMKRYQSKLTNLCKVLSAVGEWQMPVIIGLCEIENVKVLKDLFYSTPLLKYQYKIVHYNSPDPRGIDVAMVYLPDKIKLLHSHVIRVNYHQNKQRTTRDILYCKGILMNKDTLHVYVNHWPSRRNGEAADIKRAFVASLVRASVDSVFKCNPNANIVIMGDFNDEPTDESLLKSLGASTDLKNSRNNSLYNLATNYLETNHIGSLKFRGHWNLFDHIIVSGSMLMGNNKISTTLESYHVFNAPFLLKSDRSHTGSTPLRTYNGKTWENGFSDHLPVYLDVNIK